MCKYLSISLFIGLAFWSCEDNENFSLNGKWKSHNFMYELSAPNSGGKSILDSIKISFDNGFYEYDFDAHFLTVSYLNTEQGTFSYVDEPDTLFINFFSDYYFPVSYNLNNKLTLNFSEQILTSEIGEELGTYTQTMVFKKID